MQRKDQGSFLSPSEDESSREVFGLIKKLNVAPDTKKKAKPTFIHHLQFSYLLFEQLETLSQEMMLRLSSTDCLKQHFLSNLMLTGQQFCEEDWSALKKKYSSLSEDYLLRYCFSSSYIVALLHDTLGISLDDQRLMWMEMEQSVMLKLLLQPCIGTS
ncbi:PREDICTED: probable apyrase 5 isoform X2 [Nelumbo nucifera]|nr:PREDICTED: probable apyrase 5 isoform X2 [Nelumbo nucifera]XP_010277664.1 PREDICTED: probable apyrase 5 isoform X2 [Nelumbo nucifera]XP_010277665.1 PREDICTED: probable apyrase 5 isoform X2 [Nelumbo nucifera]